MAFHTGVVNGPTDFALRDSLAQYNTDAQSAKRWEKLPYAFAATLGSDMWRRAQYKARTGGTHAPGRVLVSFAFTINFTLMRVATCATAFDNNLHCLSFTILQVTATMEWIASDNAAAAIGGSGDSTWDRPIMAAVAARCEDFAACAATTIVRHSASATQASPGSRSGSHSTASGMYIFLDKVRRAELSLACADVLVPAMLAWCLPVSACLLV